jgi:hypothetical protein
MQPPGSPHPTGDKNLGLWLEKLRSETNVCQVKNNISNFQRFKRKIT